jgi:hypothetical protein
MEMDMEMDADENNRSNEMIEMIIDERPERNGMDESIYDKLKNEVEMLTSYHLTNDIQPKYYRGKLILELIYIQFIKTYSINCLIGNKHLGWMIELNDTRQLDVNDTQVKLQIELLLNCIIANSQVAIIPFYLVYPNENHANILIYRGGIYNTIEHFEPHGMTILTNNKDFLHKRNIAIEKLKYMIHIINQKLIKKNRPEKQITFITSNEVCPDIQGLQGLESQIPLNPNEGEGYCFAWSLFFTECVLKNPERPSHFIYNSLMNIFSEYSKTTRIPLNQVLKNVIKGYCYYIDSILFNNYNITMEGYDNLSPEQKNESNMKIEYLMMREIRNFNKRLKYQYDHINRDLVSHSKLYKSNTMRSHTKINPDKKYNVFSQKRESKISEKRGLINSIRQLGGKKYKRTNKRKTIKTINRKYINRNYINKNRNKKTIRKYRK